MWAEYQVSVPEGAHGPWRVERFTLDKDFCRTEELRMIFAGQGYRAPRPGTYTRLVHEQHGLVMSDTDAEVRDHFEARHAAHGRVLVTGLGLGMVLQMLLRKPEVEHVTVVEIDPDIIALVGPHYQEMFGERLTIVQGDAWTWTPPEGAHYDYAWHDIWPDLCEDNLPEMTKLHRRYRKYVDEQGSWGREQLRAERRRAQRGGW